MPPPPPPPEVLQEMLRTGQIPLPQGFPAGFPQGYPEEEEEEEYAPVDERSSRMSTMQDVRRKLEEPTLCGRQLLKMRRLVGYAKEQHSKSRQKKLSSAQQQDLLEIQREHHRIMAAPVKKAKQSVANNSFRSSPAANPILPIRETIQAPYTKSLPNVQYIKDKLKAIQDEGKTTAPEEDPLSDEDDFFEDHSGDFQASPTRWRTIEHTPGVAHVALEDLLGSNARSSKEQLSAMLSASEIPDGILGEITASEESSSEDEEDETVVERAQREHRLDELHTRLRSTYLEIQRNPHKYLNKLASQNKNYAAQSCNGPAHEIISEMLARDRARAQSKGISFVKSQPSIASVRVQNERQHLQHQWDKLASIQDSGLKGELSTMPEFTSMDRAARAHIPEVWFSPLFSFGNLLELRQSSTVPNIRSH